MDVRTAAGAIGAAAPTSRSRARVLIASAVVALIGGSIVGGSTAGAQVACTPLIPQLRDVTVTQGVGQPAAGTNGVVAPPLPRLVRGKEAIAKFFLSLPNGAPTGASISRTGGTLTVTSGSTTTTVSSTTPAPVPVYPTLAPYGSAPALASPGDATFVVPGAALAPASTTAGFDATFSATINYEYRCSPTDAVAIPGVVTFSNRPGQPQTLIKAPVERKTNALRVLLVPMGDPTKTGQFSSAAQTAATRGMETVARLYPVPDRVSSLSGSGGLRYTINAGLLNIASLMTNGRFCGSSTTFDALKAPLAQTLLNYNLQHPAAPADRVLGLADAAISDPSCDAGKAVLNGNVGWVRAIPDTSTTPSMTGGLMAMELGHMLGIVPGTRDGFSGTNHSPNQQADVTAPNRAFNLSLRSYLPDDRTAMYLSGTWNNRTVVLEQEDFLYLLCSLGGSSGGGCTTPAQPVGSSVGVAAQPTFVLSGTTDGTTAGTSVVESYIELGVPVTEPAPPGPYELVQSGPGGEIHRDPVSVDFTESRHDDDTDNGAVTAPKGLFSVAVPSDADATHVELVRGSTVLYARDRTAAPVGGSTTVTPPGSGSGPSTERVSVATGDVQANSRSQQADMSDDGRYVVFFSSATNLVPGDTNGFGDVFLHDNQTGTTERVSVDNAGAQGNSSSQGPAVSADGRFVSFMSSANNLVPGDTNGHQDIFVRDRQAGTTERVSLGPAGVQTNGNNTFATISANGRFVAFLSDATNLVTGDTNSSTDVFVRDRQAGTTERVSVDTAGGQANGGSNLPSISDDGGAVSFISGASNLVTGDTNGVTDAFVRDRQASTTERVSVDSSEAQANASTDNANPAVISGNGRYVAFGSIASNIVPADTNTVYDLFLRDRQAGTTEAVSVTGSGALPSDGASFQPGISADGRFVTFLSGSGQLVSGDTNNTTDIFLRDRQTATTERVTVNTAGVQATTGSSGSSVPSADGRYVAFSSPASNLVAGDTNAVEDVFVRDRVGDPPTGSGDEVTVSATDDNPADARADLYLNCGGDEYPLAVGLTPDEVTATGASFAYTFDPTLGCTGGVITTVVNDGFSTSTTASTPVSEDPGNSDPTPAIAAPTPDTTIQAYDAITLRGSATDREDGGLADSSLAWQLDGTGVGTGPVIDLSAPEGGWSTGTHTATLRATDGGGKSATSTVEFTVQGDADNDGVTTTLEGGGCAGGSDTDPTDGYADPDGDGIGNADDATTNEGPCTPETLYTAAVNVTPDPLNKNTTSAPVSATVTIPFRDLTAVRPDSVRITEISDTPVDIAALSWNVNGGVATATFDRATVNAVLKGAPGNTEAVFTLSGDAVDGSWSFEGNDTVATK